MERNLFYGGRMQLIDKKLVENNNITESVAPGEDNEIYYKMLKWFHNNYPQHMDRYIQSISPNQLNGKRWLINSLDDVQIPRDEEGKFKIEIIGGWFGFPLIDMLINKYGDEIREIDYFDVDGFASHVFTVYLSMWKKDMRNIKIFSNEEGDYFKYEKKRRAHLIINTSCEHMSDMKLMKEYYFDADRTLLALQSNNKTNEDDHINCVNSTEELAAQADVHTILGDWKTMKTETVVYHPNGPDEKEIDYWNRYMVFGKWDKE